MYIDLNNQSPKDIINSYINIIEAIKSEYREPFELLLFSYIEGDEVTLNFIDSSIQDKINVRGIKSEINQVFSNKECIIYKENVFIYHNNRYRKLDNITLEDIKQIEITKEKYEEFGIFYFIKNQCTIF